MVCGVGVWRGVWSVVLVCVWGGVGGGGSCVLLCVVLCCGVLSASMCTSKNASVCADRTSACIQHVNLLQVHTETS